jgi:hypothetical protein
MWLACPNKVKELPVNAEDIRSNGKLRIQKARVYEFPSSRMRAAWSSFSFRSGRTKLTVLFQEKTVSFRKILLLGGVSNGSMKNAAFQSPHHFSNPRRRRYNQSTANPAFSR